MSSSKVWEYFGLDDNDESKAICTLCKAKIQRGLGKKSYTSSLWKHLKSSHKEAYNKSKECNPPDVSCDKSAQPVTRQRSISDFITKKWDINDKRSMEVHKAIGEMIALDNQPFTIVEDKGFRKLIETLQPRYEIPSRSYFIEKVIPNLYETCKLKILEMLSGVKSVSFTSDMWTSNVNNKSFISLTVHWINNAFESKHVVLNVRSFDGSHTAENISSMLNELFLENHINFENVHLFLRDSGANIKKAAKDMKLNNESCFIHTLQLVVLDSLKCLKSVIDTITICRNIVTHFNHSSPSREKLASIQRDLNMSLKKLIQDVPTRWNSTYYLLERLFEEKRAISIFCTENPNSVSVLSQTQWKIVENLLLLLKPFEETTRHFSSTMTVISEVIPTVRVLKQYLSQTEVQEINQLKEILVENLNSRFSGIENNQNYSFATLLDPRFKTTFFAENNSQKIENEFIVYMENVDQNQNTPDVENKTNNSSSNSDSDDIPLNELQLKSTKKIKLSVWDVFCQIASSSNTTKKGSASAEKNFKIEIGEYLKLPLLNRNESPFTWWNKHAEKFPLISEAAKKFLCAPASTIFSERLFSEAGNVFEVKRNRLGSENGEKLIYLHHNISLLS